MNPVCALGFLMAQPGHVTVILRRSESAEGSQRRKYHAPLMEILSFKRRDVVQLAATIFATNPTTAPPNTSQAEFTLNRNASAALTTAIAPASGVITAAHAN
jgi:hypothetical protein